MDEMMSIAVTGAGATALMDVWMMARKRLFGMPAASYGLVGRWLGWMPRGRFVHRPIAASPPVPGELLIGWTAHYLTGIAFAAALPVFWGTAWFRQPTIWPALIVGIASVAAPFLLMQPGMGAGIAARRTPHPSAARVQSLIAHTVFGLGLYASAWLAATVAGLLNQQ